MQITSIEPFLFSKKKNRYKVRLIDGTDFVLYSKEINKYNLKEEEELTEDVYRQLLDEIFIPRAKMRAMHLLEKQDRTKANLRQKLKESGYPDDAINIAMDYVSDYNYINDLRYAQNYIRYKRNSKSKRRIINELSNKGIDKHTIEEAIYIIEDEYEESAFNDYKIIYDYISKKSSHNPLEEKEKRKVYNHLLRGGFNSSDILSAMKSLDI